MKKRNTFLLVIAIIIVMPCLWVLSPFLTSAVKHWVYSLTHNVQEIESWDCHVSTNGAQAMVVAKYYDVINGYDVSFAYRAASDTNWFVYYLNHEGPRWHNVKIQAHSNLLVIVKDALFHDRQCVAVFDTEAYSLWNNLRLCLDHKHPIWFENEERYDHLWNKTRQRMP